MTYRLVGMICINYSVWKQNIMNTPAHESKARLLDAALHVIRAKGFNAARIEDVCDTAGLTKGSFFHHFKSKDELATSAVQHWSAMTNAAFAQAPYQNLADPLARVLGYLDFRKAILQGPLPDVTCLLGTMVQEVYDTHPALRQACEKGIGSHAADVAKDIAAAKRLYAPKARWTPESLSLHIQAVLQGAFILAKATQSTQVADECLAHLRRYLVLLFDSSATVHREKS